MGTTQQLGHERSRTCLNYDGVVTGERRQDALCFSSIQVCCEQPLSAFEKMQFSMYTYVLQSGSAMPCVCSSPPLRELSRCSNDHIESMEQLDTLHDYHERSCLSLYAGRGFHYHFFLVLRILLRLLIQLLNLIGPLLQNTLDVVHSVLRQLLGLRCLRLRNFSELLELWKNSRATWNDVQPLADAGRGELAGFLLCAVKLSVLANMILSKAMTLTSEHTAPNCLCRQKRQPVEPCPKPR